MKYLIFIFLLSLSTQNTELELFKNALNKSEIQHKDIVICQAILETGWFSSKLYKENKNAFGFFYKCKFKTFNTLDDCIKYYEWWQRKWYKGGDYHVFLNCLYKNKKGRCIRYAEDKKYTEKLKHLQKTLKKQL